MSQNTKNIESNITFIDSIKIYNESGKIIVHKKDNNLPKKIHDDYLGKMNFEGFVKIFDTKTGEIFLDRKNAIHRENMSVAVAKSLISNTGGNIYIMAFGNGGTVVNSTGDITYMTPNVTGSTAALYNQTYEKTNIIGVDSTYDSYNTGEENHIAGTTYTDIIITTTLGYSEPSDQNAFDNNTATDSYTFSEIGILSRDGNLLTHIIFSPISKSLQRQLTIEYTIRISVL